MPTDRPVDLVKMDVEGFEPLALRGMKETLSRSQDAAIILEVSIEQWGRFGDPCGTLHEALGDPSFLLIDHDVCPRLTTPEEFGGRKPSSRTS